MLNIICTIEQITPIFCVFLSIIVSSINSDFLNSPNLNLAISNFFDVSVH